MNAIFVHNKWEEDKLMTKKDIINPKFECEIFINENKLIDSMTVQKINNICINFNKNYTDLSYMFFYCNSLTSINLSNFNANNVINMSFMFSYCHSLTSINLSIIFFNSTFIFNNSSFSINIFDNSYIL